MAKAVAMAERKFREHTISVLTKLDTQMDQFVKEFVQERTDRKERETVIATALREHNTADETRFAALQETQDSHAGKINMAIGGLVVLNIMVGIAVAVFA